MTGASLAQQVASLNSTLQAIEARFGNGEVPRESLEAFKSSVDDFRLRIWGLLTAEPGGTIGHSRSASGSGGRRRSAGASPAISARGIEEARLKPFEP